MVRALRRNERNHTTPLDEWIHLKEEKLINPPLKPLSGVRLIVYKELSDIPILLNGGTPPGHRLRAEAESFVPGFADLASQTNEQADDDEPEEDVMQDADGDVTGGGHVEDLEAAASSIDAGRVEQTDIAPTEEEIAAARYIQSFYRRLLRRRKITRTTSSEARTLWFKGCLEISDSLQLGLKYRVRFLGPLPHVLTFLEKANLSIHSVKKRALRRLKSPKTQHRELEEAQEQVDEAM